MKCSQYSDEEIKIFQLSTIYPHEIKGNNTIPEENAKDNNQLRFPLQLF